MMRSISILFLFTSFALNLAAQTAFTGSIRTYTGTSVNNVGVALYDAGGQLVDTIVSTGGNFSLEVPEGGDYTIAFSKEDYPLDGVSVFDLVLISKHILGIESITNFYRFYAMDVNASRSISAMDIILIRKLILSIVESFDASSWNFVKKLSNPEMPTDEEVYLNAIPLSIESGETQSLEIIGIKMGDINGSALGL